MKTTYIVTYRNEKLEKVAIGYGKTIKDALDDAKFTMEYDNLDVSTLWVHKEYASSPAIRRIDLKGPDNRDYFSMGVC